MGEIRAISEKTDVNSLVGGKIAWIRIRENQNVMKGETLVSLETDVLDSKLLLNRLQQSEKQSFIHDLNRLVVLDSATLFQISQFESSLYAQQYSQFKYNLLENIQHQEKELKELNADRALYGEKVIAMRDYDAKEFEFNRLTAQYRLLLERQTTSWQGELNTHKATLTQLLAEEQQLKNERKQYSILAPVSGTIQKVLGKYPGSYVNPGETLCTISPNDSLWAECYVSPSEIGFLETGMGANFQINAFNYNDWGMLKGYVVDVADDYVIIGNEPVFKVKCIVPNLSLTLKSGRTAKVKKGMAFQVRFLVTRRNLYQLIYDKADDWLNPSRNTISNSAW
jgi:multidrug efflux pump subunit AcrA (membrane-fusion protein)